MKLNKFLLIIIISTFFSCENNSVEINLIPVKIAGKWGYVNSKGEYEINPQYNFATSFQDDIAKVKSLGKNSKFGYINNNGKYIIHPIYTSATAFSEGLACVTTENSAPFYIDKTGMTMINLPKAQSAYVFSEGLALFSEYIKSKEENKRIKLFGFINKQGQKIIPAQFYDAESFSCGLSAVKDSNGLWGFINKAGKLIINFQFEKAELFSEDIASVYNGEYWGAINKSGRYIINPIFEKISKFKEEKAIFVQEGKRGFINKKGKIIINALYDRANLFINDIACVKINGLWGYIDDEGKYIINSQFDEASPFYGDFAIIKKDNKYGIINKKGNFIAVPQFNQIYSIIINYPTFDNIGIISYNDLYVKSDYFNAEEIINKIFINLTKEKVNNINHKSDLKEIIQYLNKISNKNIDTTKFGTYEKAINLYNIKLMKNIDLSVNVKFYDYLIERKFNYDNYSWSSTLNNTSSIKSLIYKIHLSDKIQNKADNIIKTFKNKYNFFKLSESKNTLYYKGKEYNCKIQKSSNNIFFSFNFNNKKKKNKPSGINISREDMY